MSTSEKRVLDVTESWAKTPFIVLDIEGTTTSISFVKVRKMKIFALWRTRRLSWLNAANYFLVTSLAQYLHDFFRFFNYYFGSL